MWQIGVFAAMWAKFNNRQNAYNTWIIADGPVDAIWIEDLNTVLDDNKILTLANGDRMPMTDNVKAMFEVRYGGQPPPSSSPHRGRGIGEEPSPTHIPSVPLFLGPIVRRFLSLLSSCF